MENNIDAIKFTEWLAENHYRLCNVETSTGIRYWKTETNNQKTTKQLYDEFKKAT